MHATKMFKGMVVGVMVFILALVFSLKEATAATQAEACAAQSNMVVSIAKARDRGLPMIDIVKIMVDGGLEFIASYEMAETIYRLKSHTPARLGNISWKHCMGEAA